MGYFQNTHANWNDYAGRVGVRRTCAHCGGEFTPTSPNQKRHRRNYEVQDEGEYLTAAACEDDHWKASLSRSAWVRNVTGYTVREFIEIYGMDTYLSL